MAPSSHNHHPIRNGLYRYHQTLLPKRPAREKSDPNPNPGYEDDNECTTTRRNPSPNINWLLDASSNTALEDESDTESFVIVDLDVQDFTELDNNSNSSPRETATYLAGFSRFSQLEHKSQWTFEQARYYMNLIQKNASKVNQIPGIIQRIEIPPQTPKEVQDRLLAIYQDLLKYDWIKKGDYHVSLLREKLGSGSAGLKDSDAVAVQEVGENRYVVEYCP